MTVPKHNAHCIHIEKNHSKAHTIFKSNVEVANLEVIDRNQSNHKATQYKQSKTLSWQENKQKKNVSHELKKNKMKKKTNTSINTCHSSSIHSRKIIQSSKTKRKIRNNNGVSLEQLTYHIIDGGCAKIK